MVVRSAKFAMLALVAPLMASCASTLPVPQEILAEYDRGRPIIRLPLRHANGQPLRDARAYAGRFRDDGQIYMVGQGRFELGPETLLCIYNTEVDPAAQAPWRDSDVLNHIAEQVSHGVDEFVVDVVYQQRHGDFMLRPSLRENDSEACTANRDVLYIRSYALVGRQPRNHFIVVTIEQGDTFYTFFWSVSLSIRQETLS